MDVTVLGDAIAGVESKARRFGAGDRRDAGGRSTHRELLRSAAMDSLKYAAPSNGVSVALKIRIQYA